MFLEAAVAGLIVGKFRGGSFAGIKTVKIRYLWLLIAALLIEALTSVLAGAKAAGTGAAGLGMADVGAFDAIGHYIWAIQLLRYGLLFAFIVFNLNYKALWAVGLGSFLNFLAIMANGGKMPVGPAVLNAMGKSAKIDRLIAGDIPAYCVLSDKTRLGFLSDIMPVRTLVNGMISVGDIFIAIGVFFIVQEFMLGDRDKGVDKQERLMSSNPP